MQSTERQAHWETVYGTKDPRAVSWYQHEPVISLDLIARTGMSHNGWIIDIGGGASTLVDHLLVKGYPRVAVLDISAGALEHARLRLGESGAGVEWHVCDITRFVPTHRYDLWHDRAAFHFLVDPEDRRRYVEVLSRALEPGGQMIIAAFAIGGPEKCSGLPIVQYDAAKLSAELGDCFQLLEERSESHHKPAGGEQAFNWFRYRYRPAAA